MTLIDTFGGREIDLPDTILGFEIDMSGQRVDFAYDKRIHPLVGQLVSAHSDFGLYDILHNTCGNPHKGNDGRDGRLEINEYTVTLHCVEFLYVAEVIRLGDDGGGYCYKILGVYRRDV